MLCLQRTTQRTLASPIVYYSSNTWASTVSMRFFDTWREAMVSKTLDGQMLAYNDRVARIRKSEYPMLKGTHFTLPSTTMTN